MKLHADTMPLFHTSSCTVAMRKWIDKDLTDRESESLAKVKGYANTHTHTHINQLCTTLLHAEVISGAVIGVHIDLTLKVRQL